MNNRFQAQTEAQLGSRSKLRREVHCAIPASTAAGPPARSRSRSHPACPTAGGGTIVTWCTVPNGTGRYGLWRYVGAACSGTGVKVADYLTVATPSPTTTPESTQSRQARRQLAVNLTPTKPERRFRLQDDVVLRNSTRTRTA